MFSPNEAVHLVNISTIDNDVLENDGQLTAVLEGQEGVVILNSRATATVQDNDGNNILTNTKPDMFTCLCCEVERLLGHSNFIMILCNVLKSTKDHSSARHIVVCHYEAPPMTPPPPPLLYNITNIAMSHCTTSITHCFPYYFFIV